MHTCLEFTEQLTWKISIIREENLLMELNRGILSWRELCIDENVLYDASLPKHFAFTHSFEHIDRGSFGKCCKSKCIFIFILLFSGCFLFCVHFRICNAIRFFLNGNFAHRFAYIYENNMHAPLFMWVYFLLSLSLSLSLVWFGSVRKGKRKLKLNIVKQVSELY